MNHVVEWPKRKGKAELIRYLDGKVLTRASAITAKCYECMGGYDEADLKDCEVVSCPLYPYQPYQQNVKRPKKEKKDQPNNQEERGD